MNMSRPEAHDGYGTGRFDAFISGGGPAPLACPRAEGRCLIDAVRPVLPLYAKDDLFCGNTVAFRKRPGFPIPRQGVAPKRNHFSHAPENAVARWEDLHD